MNIDSKIVTGLAGTLLLGVCGWILNSTLEIQKDIVEVRIQTESMRETLSKVYEENCPYCVHAAHSSLSQHPLLGPSMKHSHRHVGSEIVDVNE